MNTTDNQRIQEITARNDDNPTLYRITIWGMDEDILALSRSKARYLAYKSFNDAFGRVSFGYFCKYAKVRKVYEEARE